MTAPGNATATETGSSDAITARFASRRPLPCANDYRGSWCPPDIRPRWRRAGEVLGMDGRALTQRDEAGEARSQRALTARKFSAAD